MDRRPCEPSPREKRESEVNKANDVPRARRHRMDRNTATLLHRWRDRRGSCPLKT
jgi:hypothetical protein